MLLVHECWLGVYDLQTSHLVFNKGRLTKGNVSDGSKRGLYV